MFTIVFAVNRSTLRSLISLVYFFLQTGNYVYIYLENCISILAEKSYLSSRINDQFVCGIQPLLQKLFVKAAVSQFVPFSLSSITLHKLICATTLPFPVSWTPYFDFKLRLTSNPNLTRNLIYFSLQSFSKVSKRFEKF